jgi:outer membrane protein assembly factor BamA
MASPLRLHLSSLVLLSLFLLPPCMAQAPPEATAKLYEIHADGMKSLTEAQIAALSKLELGSLVGKSELQASADRLLQTGLFSSVNYKFETSIFGVSLSFHVQESPRMPVFFDNIPWFTDGEFADAIRAQLPFYDGTLPEGGSVIDEAATAVSGLLASHALKVTLEHQVIPNPIGDGSVQEFHIEGAELKIASVEFGDSALTSNKTIQQHLSELIGKPYSRMTIDIFLTEQVRPLYLEKGFLRVKLGPSQVRLTGNPNLKLPSEIPVFIPVAAGPVYHWKDLHWTGNSVLSTFTLTKDIGLQPGDVANGMRIEAGWQNAEEEYGHVGYLDAKIDPVASYDDQAHTISYAVTVHEGIQYRLGTVVLTGISPADERRLLEAWPIHDGEVLDKTKFEDFLVKLETHSSQIFGELPVHYDTVGHWLRTDPAKGIADVLLDFK